MLGIDWEKKYGSGILVIFAFKLGCFGNFGLKIEIEETFFPAEETERLTQMIEIIKISPFHKYFQGNYKNVIKFILKKKSY